MTKIHWGSVPISMLAILVLSSGVSIGAQWGTSVRFGGVQLTEDREDGEGLFGVEMHRLGQFSERFAVRSAIGVFSQESTLSSPSSAPEAWTRRDSSHYAEASLCFLHREDPSQQKGAYVLLGPRINFLLGSESSADSETATVPGYDPVMASVGLIGGAGVVHRLDSSTLFLEVRGEIGLTDHGPGSESASNRRVFSFVLGVGY